MNGFQKGFDLHYVKPCEMPKKRYAHNLKLRVGSKLELWNKVMKEVQLKHFVGSYEQPLYKEFIESPIG